jgi:hypothetical protein
MLAWNLYRPVFHFFSSSTLQDGTPVATFIDQRLKLSLGWSTYRQWKPQILKGDSCTRQPSTSKIGCRSTSPHLMGEIELLARLQSKSEASHKTLGNCTAAGCFLGFWPNQQDHIVRKIVFTVLKSRTKSSGELGSHFCKPHAYARIDHRAVH